MKPQWTVKTLGASALHDGNKVAKLSRRKSLALLIYLVVNKREYERESLANLFWPDLSESDGRTALRACVSDLNKALGNNWHSQNGSSLSLNFKFPITTDLQNLMLSSKSTKIVSQQVLTEYCEDFLTGFRLEGCDVFEEWCYVQKEFAKTKLFELLESQLNMALTEQDWPRVSEIAWLWLNIDSLSEKPYLALMKKHQFFGERTLALQEFQKLSSKLYEELGVSPSVQALKLKEDINNGLPLLPFSTKQNQPQTAIALQAEVSYFKSGSTHIAYKKIVGTGPILVIVMGFITHLDQLTEEPKLSSFVEQLSSRFTVLIFDKRGMGLSDRTGAAPTLFDTSSDIIALLNHLNLSHAWVMGISEGGPAAITCAHQNPKRITGLILAGTSAKWTSSEDYSHSIGPENYIKWLDYMDNSWGTEGNLKHFIPSCSNDEFIVKWWKKTLRMASSPGTIRNILFQAKSVDVRQQVKTITQPTLVVQTIGDKLIRVGNGKYLHSQLKNSEYLELPGEDHWFWVSQADAFFRKLDQFLITHA